MKNLYIVSYDVMNHKRLYHVFKTMKGYGAHFQYSLFLCQLNPKQKVMLNEALLEIINQNEDRVIIVNLGPVGRTSKSRIEILGNQEALKESTPTIV